MDLRQNQPVRLPPFGDKRDDGDGDPGSGAPRHGWLGPRAGRVVRHVGVRGLVSAGLFLTNLAPLLLVAYFAWAEAGAGLPGVALNSEAERWECSARLLRS